ncbi:hypothetical protein CQA53_00285 [Helicobacter didelphidarum]|uniref:Thioredoxin-like fold domain-containing protein n=1 Tax=Helicobacter didelphidarum TaxID=2040648 RepID=A0A3D8IQW5_9HELI|nr:thioredoxin fold domain-containing protein [Helicobacter didelphidarum]RDU67503.1 hypothetical protein CQA53_00285 [Helicobacter didelphidarum]
MKFFIHTILSHIFVIVAISFIVACKDKGIDISDGNNKTEELENKIDSINLEIEKSYKGLEDIFVNSSLIDSDKKPILLIFGRNYCKYCEDLKNDIKSNEEIKNTLKENFVSYYINTSYSKEHRVGYLDKTMDTDELARHYNLTNTPLVLFLESNGNEILNMVGYNKVVFPPMIDFVLHNKAYKNEKDSKKRMQLFLDEYVKKSKNH